MTTLRKEVNPYTSFGEATWTAGDGGTWTDAGFFITEVDDTSDPSGYLATFKRRYFPDRSADTILEVYAKELAAKRS